MSFYSVAAFSTISWQSQEPLVFIEPGVNAFTVTVDDIDALVSRLKAEGIRIDAVNQLDGSDAHIVGRLGS
jgi:hypothetical protein